MASHFGLTEHIDLALIALYAFWAFFAGLLWYLHRENKREGYPLVSDRTNGRFEVVGLPVPPPPKTYRLPHGGTVMLPSGKVDTRDLALRQTASFFGAPFEPTGDPLAAGVGPGSWVPRADIADQTIDGAPKIVPLRTAADFYLAEGDPDPRGWPVVGGDHGVAGTVTDVWIDRSEYLARYYELELPAASGGRRVLVPANFAKLDKSRGRIFVRALYADQFAGVPATKAPDQVTLLEEDKIVGYFGGGLLYAHPSRTESLL